MSPPSSPKIWFITGSDTGVGKTFVASALLKQLRHSGVRVAAYKPVASGCQREAGQLISEDAVALWEAAGKAHDLAHVCPQRFAAPLAPNAAARAENRVVDELLLSQGIVAFLDAGLIIVEGAGGLMSPLSDQSLNAHLAQRLGAEIIIVVANHLGAIHQSLATLAAAERYQLAIKCIYLNTIPDKCDASTETNAREIRRWINVPILQLSEIGLRTS